MVKDLEAIPTFLNRLEEVASIAGTLTANTVDVQMSRLFAREFIYQCKLRDIDVRGNHRRYTCFDDKGHLDFRFKINSQLPGRSFRIQVKKSG